MEIRFKKLNSLAVVPTKAHAGDAGFDLVCTSCSYDEYGNIVYGTGLAIELPENHVGFIFPRSSLSKYDLVQANSVSVIDSGYRGEMFVKFRPNLYFGDGAIESGKRVYEVGERIGQLIIMPYPTILFREVDELSSSDRGTSSFGDSGR
jgi:dUTP pyrophosphatase